jgi:hypothetical protein
VVRETIVYESADPVESGLSIVKFAAVVYATTLYLAPIRCLQTVEVTILIRNLKSLLI